MDSIRISGVDSALGIFLTGGDKALYRRFLSQFPQDDTFSMLGKAIICGRTHEAFLCAHTLKGLTAQLGILALSVPAASICELLRPLEDDALDQAASVYEAMTPVYRRIVNAIHAL